MHELINFQLCIPGHTGAGEECVRGEPQPAGTGAVLLRIPHQDQQQLRADSAAAAAALDRD
jgi:hypothetical protein